MNILKKTTKLSTLGFNFRTNAIRFKHVLPELSFDYKALEPIISADIMNVHHGKHHQTYVNNLNVTEEKLNEALAKKDLVAATNLLSAMKFNSGGHINHSIYWTNLCPNGGGEPSGDLMTAIKNDLGSYENLKTQMSAVAIGVQGSGWAWLGYDPKTKRLRIASCGNQDLLEATHGLVPLLAIDVWEHAYYLQYKNVRPDYVKAIWDIINWKNVAERLQKAKS